MVLLSARFSLCTSLALLEIPSAPAGCSGFKDCLTAGAPVVNGDCSAGRDREICVRSNNFGNSNAGLLPSWKAQLCPEFVAAAIRNSLLLYKCQFGTSLPKKFALKLSVRVWKVESLYKVNLCTLLKKKSILTTPFWGCSCSGPAPEVRRMNLKTHWKQEERNFAEVQVNLVFKHPYCQLLFFSAVNGYCWSVFYWYFIPHNTTYII